MREPTSLSLTFDCWNLGLEACSVIGMRLPRLMTGQLGTSGPAMLDASVAHYRKAVRRNQRRLGGTQKSR